MSCEHYQRAITDSLAAGDELPRKLRAHADSCSACRAALEAESALFSAIDAGIRERMNEVPPPGLIAGVRTRLAAQPEANRAWVPLWAAVALPAAVALLLVITLAIHRPSPHPGEKSENVAQQEPSPAAPLPAPTRNVRPVGNAHPLRGAAASGPAVELQRDPEVLVAAGEEVSFLRSLKFLQRDGRVLSPDRNALETPLAINPLELPLLDAESEEKPGTASANQE